MATSIIVYQRRKRLISASMRKIFVIIALSLAGCSAHWPHSYSSIRPEIHFRGFGSAVVLVNDQRPAVLRGTMPPQRVGTIKSVADEPRPIVTSSGLPFAEEVAAALCAALDRQGFECSKSIGGRADLTSEIAYLREKYAPARILVLTVNQWNSEVLMTAAIDYNLLLTVFNGAGETMASVKAQGEEKLHSALSLNPARFASQAVPAALQEILKSMLSNQQVEKSMNMVRGIDVLGAGYR